MIVVMTVLVDVAERVAREVTTEVMVLGVDIAIVEL